MRPILVVDDDEAVAHTLARQLARYRDVVATHDVSSAVARLELASPVGLIVDIHLGAGDLTGFDVLTAARRKWPVPAMVLTGLPTAECRSLATQMGAAIARKPIGRDALGPFLHAVFAFDYGVSPSVASVVKAKAVEAGLTPAEVDILAANIAGAGRKAYLQRRNVSENTYRSHVTDMLAKLGMGSRMSEVVATVLREASRA